MWPFMSRLMHPSETKLCQTHRGHPTHANILPLILFNSSWFWCMKLHFSSVLKSVRAAPSYLILKDNNIRGQVTGRKKKKPGSYHMTPFPNTSQLENVYRCCTSRWSEKLVVLEGSETLKHLKHFSDRLSGKTFRVFYLIEIVNI